MPIFRPIEGRGEERFSMCYAVSQGPDPLGPYYRYEFRRKLFGLTESAGALINWKARHGQLGHKAENAAFGAALGLFSREHLTREQYASLVEPMAEALPWLLPDRAPAPRKP